jgi:ubiquinone/menaquinone biosynthesis C-methylase UbiE
MRTVGDAEVRQKGLEQHAVWRERILDNARLEAGETLLDIGCGEGLVAFGGLERGAGHVLFSDISQDLLNFCREAATTAGVVRRCRFVKASADQLSGIENESIDAVTTRSVLIYVAHKQAAFHEFARVLRSGGRVSLLEPINRFAQTTGNSWIGFDFSPIPEIVAKLRAVYDAIQPPHSDPMVDFDERDLIVFAEEAGFRPIQLELEAEIRPSDPIEWESFIHRPGNPRIPSFSEAMNQALTEDERERLTAYLRPLVEEGRGTWRMAIAFLHAAKP